MDSLYDELLREFQRLKKSSSEFGEVFVSLPSIPGLALVREKDAINMIYGEGERKEEGEEIVWVLHVPKGAKPELAISHIQGQKDDLRDMPEERARSMAATLLEQLAKVEA